MLPTILEIIRLSLEITLKIIEDMPADQKKAAWERHGKNMEFWEDVFKKLSVPEFRAAADGTRS